MAKNFLEKQINRKIGGFKRSARAKAKRNFESSGFSGCIFKALAIIGWAIFLLLVGMYIYLTYFYE